MWRATGFPEVFAHPSGSPSRGPSAACVYRNISSANCRQQHSSRSYGAPVTPRNFVISHASYCNCTRRVGEYRRHSRVPPSGGDLAVKVSFPVRPYCVHKCYATSFSEARVAAPLFYCVANSTAVSPNLSRKYPSCTSLHLRNRISMGIWFKNSHLSSVMLSIRR